MELIRNCLFFVMASLFCGALESKVIMWDLGGTLCEIRRVHFGRQLGLFSTMWYAVHDKQSPRELMNTLYSVLEQGGIQEGEALELVEDDRGNPFPLLLCEWLAGNKTPDRVQSEALQYLEEATPSIIHNKRQKKLLNHLIRALFDPQQFALSIKPISKATNLFKKSVYSRDRKTGKRNITVILSNWDPVSFRMLYRLKTFYKKIFRYIHSENIFISGDLQILKPQKAFFEAVLKKGKFDPSECIFIDDQEKNVQAALACGITGIHLKDKDYKALEQKLEELGVL
jgi:hypothetical protein